MEGRGKEANGRESEGKRAKGEVGGGYVEWVLTDHGLCFDCWKMLMLMSSGLV